MWTKHKTCMKPRCTCFRIVVPLERGRKHLQTSFISSKGGKMLTSGYLSGEHRGYVFPVLLKSLKLITMKNLKGSPH